MQNWRGCLRGYVCLSCCLVVCVVCLHQLDILHDCFPISTTPQSAHKTSSSYTASTQQSHQPHETSTFDSARQRMLWDSWEPCWKSKEVCFRARPQRGAILFPLFSSRVHICFGACHCFQNEKHSLKDPSSHGSYPLRSPTCDKLVSLPSQFC